MSTDCFKCFRDQWIQDAEDAEKAGSIKTCQSIIKYVIGEYVTMPLSKRVDAMLFYVRFLVTAVLWSLSQFK